MYTRWLWKTLATTFCILHMSQATEDSNVNGLKPNNRLQVEQLNEFGNSNLEINKMQSENIEEFLESQMPHSRKKRLIWVTDDGRLALPPGTALTISPTISLPLVRHPPEGFLSNISVSFPLSIDFDKLGLTDNQNPLGELPPLLARSFGKAAGSMLGGYISHYLNYRKRRDLFNVNIPKSTKDSFNVNFAPHENEIPPELPEKYKHVFHGGERVLLYGAVEDLLSTFGMDGRACLLRTICEVHSKSLDQLGFLGEIFKLFLTATKSPFAEYMPDYVRAQKIGEGEIGPGECFPYYKACPRSIFKNLKNHKYREDSEDEFSDERISNVIGNEIQSKLHKNSDSVIKNIPAGILPM